MFYLIDRVYLKLIKITTHFSILVIYTLCVTVSKYCKFLMPFCFRDKRVVFTVHIFVRVYSKAYNETASSFSNTPLVMYIGWSNLDSRISNDALRPTALHAPRITSYFMFIAKILVPHHSVYALNM